MNGRFARGKGNFTKFFGQFSGICGFRTALGGRIRRSFVEKIAVKRTQRERTPCE